MTPLFRETAPSPVSVWTVLETAGNSARVVAVKTSESAATIAAKVLRSRWGTDEAWRITVSGPHEVRSDYV